jgi:hypothetical protein
MKLRYLACFLVFILLFAVSLNGCGSIARVDVPQTLNNAKDKMEEGDLDGASADYEAAVAADPSNAEANFGAALLGIFGVAVDEDTRALAAEFGVTTPTTLNELIGDGPSGSAASKVANFSTYVQAEVAPGELPGEIQTYIKNTLIPALYLAQNRLSVVESDANFQFIITSGMSGDDSSVEIDLGEVYALDLYCSAMMGWLYEAISYNWDYTTSDPIDDANFGSLKSDGANNMAAARSAYLRAMTKWIAGINFIDAETDDQSDDAIPKFNSQADKDDMLDGIGQVKNSFENGDTAIDITPDVSVTVDFKTYYLSPLADWKEYNAEDFNNLPAGYDFTLNGLFPNMASSTDWENLANSVPGAY